MPRPCETVRTDEYAALVQEIPFWQVGQGSCGVHRVSWWTDDMRLDELTGCKPLCPVCNGGISMALLIFLEEPQVERCRQAVLPKPWDRPSTAA